MYRLIKFWIWGAYSQIRDSLEPIRNSCNFGGQRSYHFRRIGHESVNWFRTLRIIAQDFQTLPRLKTFFGSTSFHSLSTCDSCAIVFIEFEICPWPLGMIPHVPGHGHTHFACGKEKVRVTPYSSPYYLRGIDSEIRMIKVNPFALRGWVPESGLGQTQKELNPRCRFWKHHFQHVRGHWV